MAKEQRYKQQEIISVVERSENGDESEVADYLGCTTRTLRNYKKRYPAVQEAFDLRKERQKDFVEGRLMDQIKRGNITAIIFYLKTQAKDRGYVERQEVTGANGGAIVVDWDGIDSNQD